MLTVGAAAAGRVGMLTNSWHGLKPGIATVSDITAAVGAPNRQFDGVRYGSVVGLHLMSYDDLPASLFLRDERLLLIVIEPRVGSGFPTQLGEWERELGPAAKVLPSIDGKNHRVHVYSEAGLTVTAEGALVSSIEIFSPMTPDEYEGTLYIPAPVFRK
jgi:hypothetical protein